MEALLNAFLSPPAGAAPLDVYRISTALTCAFGISVLISWLYPRLHQGDVQNARLGRVMILTSMVTTLIIMPISTNITLSLGMVGALSIVRFRTAIKEPLDIAFMFWAIAVGVATGAGFYVVSTIGSAVIALLLLLSLPLSIGKRSGCLMVLRYLPSIDKIVTAQLPPHRLLSKHFRPDMIDLTIELKSAEEGIELANGLATIAGIEDISVIDATGDFYQTEAN